MPREHQRDPSTSLWSFVTHRMRRDRDRAGFTREELAPRLEISQKLYGHYENRLRVPPLDVCRRLDGVYGHDEFYAGLQPHVEREAESGCELPEYTIEEELADSIWSYQPLLVETLLQTRKYAATVVMSGANTELAEEVLQQRLKRQGILDREDAPYLVAMMTESGLRERVGDVAVMREQYEHLLEMSLRPRVCLQVIRTGSGAHMAGALTLLGFPEGGDMAYVDAWGGLGRVVGGASTVHRLRREFDRIRTRALNVQESETLIRSLMERI
jgi:transcriptional regulator with XRE-family HTH domain